jgi:hypothetical protein
VLVQSRQECSAFLKDLAAPFAQFFIPGTGPGSRHGFSDDAAINVLNSDYRHSSCFDIAELQANLADGGLWDRFLRRAPETLAEEETSFYPPPWRPVTRPIRGLVRLLGIGLLAAFAFILLTLISIGWLQLSAWLGLELI